MPWLGHFAREFVLVAPPSLLMLTLFDSNAWWKVLFFSSAAAVLNTLFLFGRRMGRPAVAIAFGRGMADALLAFLLGLTPLFRTTFGTLLGFILLLGMTDLIIIRFTNRLARWEL